MFPLTQSPAPPPSDVYKTKAIQALGSLPPFSPILNRLLASLGAEDVSFARIADLIEKDTVLAGNILHLVNSALYARRGTVNSVRHALSLLGINKLRNAVLGMSITRMWHKTRPPASWSMARFNLHSAAAAILSDLLAQRLPVEYPEGAFVAGLLHDVGRLLIALGLPEQYEQIQKLHEMHDVPLLECEEQVLGFRHPELSATALEIWKLPEPILIAVRDHHAPPPPKNGPLPIARVVCAADRYVNSIDVSITPRPTSSEGEAAALALLKLDDAQRSATVAEFQAEFEAMSPLFR